METVTVRELSGELITRATAQGQTLGITNRGSLVGVLLPLTRHVLERLGRRDAAEIGKGVHQAEVEMASGERLSTLSELEEGHLHPTSTPTFSRVAIRDLTGKRLTQASADGKAVIVTSDGASVALLIPVTASWMERLVEGGIRRFLDGETSIISSPDIDRDEAFADSVQAIPEIAVGGDNLEQSLSITASRAGTRWSTTGSPFITVGSAHDFLQSVAIGIEITSDSSDNKRLVGVVTDMLAKVEVGPRERSLENTDERHVLAQILDLIYELQSLIGADQRLVGVGMELGGHVHNGRVIYSPNAHWTQFPLAGRLTTMLNVPVILENDANALAIYERRFTGIEDHSFAVIVLTEVGVGCGLMLDGQIYHGVRGMAGELGHVPVALGDPGEQRTCRCVNNGCLEAAATPHAIDIAIRDVEFDGTYEDALRSPMPEAVRVPFRLAGAALGRAVVSVINLINPSAIIFYGPQELLGPPRSFHVEEKHVTHTENQDSATSAARLYTESMTEAIRNSAFSTGVYEDCRFIVRSPSNLSSARAAAACLIDRFALASRESASRP
jgi:predicted NBD/HSP70 family sugar kinase/antitoxin (DNA-binding transcriptional repressor) of toxin-antitoxin stability system